MRTDLGQGEGGGVASSGRALCTHCRAPLPSSAEDEFCCNGCRHVHDLLQESGLSRYYALRGDRTLSPVAGESRLGEALWLEQLEARLTTQGNIKRVSLDVQGIQCGACVWLIDALFKREPDGYQVSVNPALGQLSCAFGAGFSLCLVRHHAVEVRLPARARAQAGRVGQQLLATPHRRLSRAGGQHDAALPPPRTSASRAVHSTTWFSNASFVLTTLSRWSAAATSCERAVQSIRRGVLHLDLPIALGMGLAYVRLGLVALLRQRLGQLPRHRQRVHRADAGRARCCRSGWSRSNRRKLLSSDGASGLLARRAARWPQRARGLHRAAARATSCWSARARSCPCARTLLEPRASCSLDWINGESEPRSFKQGDELLAGAINVGSSAFRATALAGFDRSELDTLLRDDSTRGARLAATSGICSRACYVLLVLLATAAGVVAWLLAGASVLDALSMATAVLVVTCPCAFGIATPLAYELGVAGLRKLGLFVRDGSFFDRAARVYGASSSTRRAH